MEVHQYVLLMDTFKCISRFLLSWQEAIEMPLKASGSISLPQQWTSLSNRFRHLVTVILQSLSFMGELLFREIQS